MAYAPYTMLFTDQNLNREFIIQPQTANGPITPTGGVDPSASTANTTLFLYGQGHPNYGERIQEDMVYMLEHFFNPNEPSFPIPGQVWCKSSSNEITNPFQLFVFNPRKYKITATTGSNIYVQSDDGSESVSTVFTRWQTLGLAKQFNVYDSAYNQVTFIQAGVPVISGSNVQLTVTPNVPVGGLSGQWTGGWEELYQGNATITLRRAMSAGGFNIINAANPVNPQDVATKAYVDLAVGGGTLTLAGLADVSITAPTTGQILQYNGIKWFNSSLGSIYLPLTGGTMAGVIDMGGNILTDLPLPINPFDATSKQYVDGQPLSGTNVTITTPANQDILYYSLGTATWLNAQPAVAGIVPIAGAVTMTGFIDMGSNVLTGIPTPTNPLDAANKAYVDAAVIGAGVVISGSYNSSTGVLTLVNSGAFPPVNVPGFIPVVYPIPVPTTSTNQFFALNAGQSSPTATTVNLALNQLDAALGNFVVPRQQLVFVAPGGRTTFDINNLAWATPAVPPARMYVKGSHNLAVYLNGIKQIASTSGIAKITSSVLRDDFDITFGGGSCNVNVNGLGAVVVTIGAQTTLGDVCDAINTLALTHFINPVVTAAGGSFTVLGDVHTNFPVGTNFSVNYSGTTNDITPFTVSVSGSTFGGVYTTINVTPSIPVSINKGVIFQNNWGFSVSIENGAFVFHSNIAGSGSSIVVTDTNLFSGITGVTYPITGLSSLVTTGNSLAPATFGYTEVGMNGYQSSLFQFTTAPPNTDTIEVMIDREMVYNTINPLAAAIIA